MITDYNDFSQYDQVALKQVIQIDEMIQEELNKEKMDAEKVTKLRFAQLLKGIEANCGYDWQH